MMKDPFIRKITAAFLGLVFLIIVSEIFLRLAGGAVMFMQARVNKISLAGNETCRIMCVGESTTADLTGLGGPGISYPRQLGEILNREGGGMSFAVINKGIPSGNSAMILAELERNLDTYKPDIVVAMMGMSDGREVLGVDVPGGISGNLLRAFKSLKLVKLLSIDMARKRKIGEILNEPFYIGTGFDPIGRKDPLRGPAYAAMSAEGYGLMKQGDLAAAEKVFLANAGNDEKTGWDYIILGEAYRRSGVYDKAEKIYRAIMDGSAYGPGREGVYGSGSIDRQTQQLVASLYLGLMFLDMGELDKCESVFKVAAQIRPDLAYRGLAALYGKKGDEKLAAEYKLKALESSPENSNPATKKNYNKLRDILRSRGITLVCVQYPLRDVNSLIKLFDDPRGIIFVDNEAVFREVLRTGSYDDYFIDRCYSDFGHGTARGNRLIAENVATAILRSLSFGSRR